MPLNLELSGRPSASPKPASFINRLSQAVDRIESQSQPRQWKVVEVRRDPEEDTDVALERHFAAHPEDRDANVVIWKFFD